jgi:hypothetical protein
MGEGETTVLIAIVEVMRTGINGDAINRMHDIVTAKKK